jgi:NAD(P)H-dependent FMN reductase
MKFLAFSLSLRQRSYNKKLIQIVNKIFQVTNGLSNAELEIIDLLDYDMPAYNQDMEDTKGFPVNAEQFKAKLDNCQGIIIASPEYNYSYPGYFKNIFDWISRYTPMPWSGKSVLFLSASPSTVGGERSLWHLRVPFEGCGAYVYPKVFALHSAYNAFNENDQLVEEKKLNNLESLISSFVKFSLAVADVTV